MARRNAALVFAVCLGLSAPALTNALAGVQSEDAAPQFHFTNGEASIDSLIEKFRQALVDKDKNLLRSLRVTEDEYRNFIMPGSVDEGRPRAQYTEQASEYFWGILNGRSIYSEANLLHDFGGHEIKFTKVEYRKGVQKYRDYTAYKQLILTVENENGEPEVMKIGSIAEVDGQFKFISFVRD